MKMVSFLLFLINTWNECDRSIATTVECQRMCGGMEHSSEILNGSCEGDVSNSQDSMARDSSAWIDSLDVDDDFVSYLLELAADNDLSGFKEAAKDDVDKVFGIGKWYSREYGTARMVLERRTPAMIAALYGSVAVLKYILSLNGPTDQINMACGSDGSTALHCAAAGGSSHAVEIVKLLLAHGADLNLVDAQGRRPADVISKTQILKNVRKTLESLLESVHPADVANADVNDGQNVHDLNHLNEIVVPNLVEDGVSSATECTSSPLICSSSPLSSPMPADRPASKHSGDGNEKSKEYPVDPSIPDIKNSIYMTDEFRMFSFKVRPCSRAYSHDWTECPFVHPGENARRRDPRRYHYSCVPCPDFRKGACRRGDACEYAHGVFECWLHPAQYRTRLCKDGTDCTRRVCFFAHTNDELRPLYMSSGSTIPSPRASLDLTAMSPPLAPGSPSSGLMASSFSLSSSAQVNHGTPPLSPSSSSANPATGGWSSTSVPVLHLPASRLRSALNARDLSLDELGDASDFDGQLLGDYLSICSQALSTQARLNAAVAASVAGTTSSSRTGKYRSLGLNVAPTNLDELFAAEMVSSPRAIMHDPLLMETQVKSPQMQPQLQGQVGSQAFMPISDQLQMQLQQTVLESQLQGPPRLYSSMQTPAPPESHILGSPRTYSMQTPSHSLGSLSRMSALGGPDVDRQSSNFAGHGPHGRMSAFGLDIDKQQVSNAAALSPGLLAARGPYPQRDMRSHSSRELGMNSALSDWGSPTGKPEWSTHGDDLSRLRKSTSFGLRESEEADLSWVQSLAKQVPKSEGKEAVKNLEDGAPSLNGNNTDAVDLSKLGSWIEKLHLDQIIT